jgi:Integrase
MPDFSLSKRYDSTSWYVSFKNPYTNKYGTKKSTGTTNKQEAVKIAYKMLFEEKENAIRPILEALRGMDLSALDAAEIVDILDKKKLIATIITKDDAGAESITEFLCRFWDYDTSLYVKEKLHKNHSIHKKYVKSNKSCVEMHWKPFFQDTPIAKLTKSDLNDFMDNLDPDLSGARKNNILKVGTIALKWAYTNQLIKSDITEGIIWFSKDEGERFIFTPEQAAELFSRKWPDETSKLANMLAMTTGLRSGEIMALKKRDLGENCLYVGHSWNYIDKQKTTKNNESRHAYILFPEIRIGLKKQAESNPYEAGLDGYIFWATIPGKPRENPAWLRDLRIVAKEIGFTDIEKISFHAWRHFFTTYMLDELDEKVVQKATEHKTIEMVRHYANHARASDASAIQEAMKKDFDPILYAG